MCIHLSNHPVPFHCVSFLEKADKKICSLGCSVVQAVTRLFLLTVIPLTTVVGFLHAFFVFLVPIGSLECKQRFKNLAMATLLLPLTPIIMLLYLIQGKIGDNPLFSMKEDRCSEQAMMRAPHLVEPALPEKPRRGSLSDLPIFFTPSGYPDTPVCRAIGEHRWADALKILKSVPQQKQKQLMTDKFSIRWNDGAGEAVHVVTLVEFILLMLPVRQSCFIGDLTNTHSRWEFSTLLRELYEIVEKDQSLKVFSGNPQLAPALANIMKVFFNSCCEEEQIANTCQTIIWQYLTTAYSYKPFFLWAKLMSSQYLQAPDASLPLILNKSAAMMANDKYYHEGESKPKIQTELLALSEEWVLRYKEQVNDDLEPLFIKDIRKIILEYLM